MPYRVKNKILGLSKRKALGIKLPFGSAEFSSVFSSTYQTVDMYKTNILNYFMTGKGDRFMNPDFGNTIQSLLFGQGNLSTESKISIQSSIEQDLEYYFPKLTVNSVTLEEFEGASIQIAINFTVNNTGISDELVVDFN